MAHEMLFEFHGELPELTKTLFRGLGGNVKTAVRGKTSGALGGAGTFQWTSAVRALSIIVIRAALAHRTGAPLTDAALLGEAGSPAATLDYAVSKEPEWSVDMFGVDSDGRSLIRRLINRTNSERKYPGPVTVSFNSRFIPTSAISVWWNGRHVEDESSLRVLERKLFGQFTNVRSRESPAEFFEKLKAA